ncbi:glycoside hydrolase [Raphidocelis subcapitata]|uniref:Glycoside hydrolase n=1 Tax=Raphidocelis subcapitata TaxID=307507 RepID=A0A2V0NVX3_9CHLO|nr:glycoside hydrolase [Raphidocelis subcapitata]|eukprot:GBF90832.1 glycoside hydrolase [Raphidocelis subcapitata]
MKGAPATAFPDHMGARARCAAVLGLLLLAGGSALALLRAGAAAPAPGSGAGGSGAGDAAPQQAAPPAPRRASPQRWARGAVADGADDAVFQSGTLPVDENGLPVHAHEGQLLAQDDGLLLWYGTGQKRQVEGGEWLSQSIHLYTTRDLVTWRDKGRVFQATAIPTLSVPPPYRIERVAALYSSDRRQFILVFGLTSLDRSLSTVGYASSVSAFGPFRWELEAPPDALPSRDVGVAQDGGSGAAYLVRTISANATAVSRMKPSLLGTAGVCSVVPRGGASALFKSGGRWYMLVSSHKGWQPGRSRLFVASDPAAPCDCEWTQLRRVAEGAGADTTFDSVPAAVYVHRWGDGSELPIYLGDRWNAAGEGGVANASYVWLPMVRDAADPRALQLTWLERWRLGDWKPPPPS